MGPGFGVTLLQGVVVVYSNVCLSDRGGSFDFIFPGPNPTSFNLTECILMSAFPTVAVHSTSFFPGPNPTSFNLTE